MTTKPLLLNLLNALRRRRQSDILATVTSPFQACVSILLQPDTHFAVTLSPSNKHKSAPTSEQSQSHHHPTQRKRHHRTKPPRLHNLRLSPTPVPPKIQVRRTKLPCSLLGKVTHPLARKVAVEFDAFLIAMAYLRVEFSILLIEFVIKFSVGEGIVVLLTSGSCRCRRWTRCTTRNESAVAAPWSASSQCKYKRPVSQHVECVRWVGVMRVSNKRLAGWQWQN